MVPELFATVLSQNGLGVVGQCASPKLVPSKSVVSARDEGFWVLRNASHVSLGLHQEQLPLSILSG